jgi:hypothetical protein
MEQAVGTAFYQNILRDYGRVNLPKLIRDVAVKRKVLQMLESVAGGIDRLEAVVNRVDPSTAQALLAKLQAPPSGRDCGHQKPCNMSSSDWKNSRGQSRRREFPTRWLSVWLYYSRCGRLHVTKR